MKKHLYYYLILATALQLYAEEEIAVTRTRRSGNTGQAESLKGKIVAKQREVESTIQSIPGATDLVNQWKKFDQQIKNLEDTHGITPLINTLNSYHEKACQFQRTNSQSREIMRKIGNLRNEIDQKTKSEQQKINNLYEEIESTNDANKQKVIGSQIKQYQQSIQSKSKDKISQMDALNKELRQLHEIQEILSDAREVSTQLRQAASKIKSQVNALEKNKQNVIDKLSQLVARSELSDKIYDGQDALNNLKRNMARQDPCLSDITRPSYIQYLN